MKKVIFVSLGIAALMGTGCVLDLSGQGQESNPPRPISPVEVLLPFFDTDATSSTQGHLQIHVKTPVMNTGLTPEKRTVFNQRIKMDSDAIVDTFRQDFSSPDNTDPRGDEASPWTLDMDYTIPTSTGRIQSVLLRGYQYTGGAHGNTFTRAYMFDLKDGKFLTLNDLFEEWAVKNFPDSTVTPLEQIAERSRTILFTREYVKDDYDWVVSGTEQKSENFSVLYATPEGLGVYFSDYQVAPHAVGPQTVIIPWKKLVGVKNEYLP